MIGVSELDAEWTAALHDAGVAREATRLYIVDRGEATTAAGAVWFQPGSQLDVHDQFPDASQVADANRDEHRRLHRIVVWRDVELAVLAGRLRHELEHVRQWERLGAEFFELYDVTLEVLAHKAAGLDGCAGTYVNSIPAELDCNAAAAMFLRNRHMDAVARLCRDNANRVLACSIVGPEPVETLPARTVAFMYVYRGRCADVERERELPFDQVLERSYNGAGAMWTALDGAASQLR